MKPRVSHPVACVCLSGLLGGAALPASAACGSATLGSLTNLPTDVGDAFQVYGLSAAGQLTGYFYPSGSPYPHAFLYGQGAVTDLGTLGGPVSEGLAINSAGVVAGDSYLSDFQFHAFLAQSNPPVDLGTLGGTFSTPYALNDSGQVVGASYTLANTSLRAFLYSDNVMNNLETLGGDYSVAFAINGPGSVTGESTTANGDTHAFLYTAGTMLDLGTLGGTNSSPAALNDSGAVVGRSILASGLTHGFLFVSNQMVDLGTLGGTQSTAFGINRSGQVIGIANTPNDAESHGFIYSGGTMTDLGTLGGSNSTPAALNNAGQIVGTSSLSNGVTHPFLWEKGHLVDLNSLLPENSGWELTDARFINDAGRVVGMGLYQGAPQWFILDVVPGNNPPVAVAGPAQVVEFGNPVILDGTASSDPDGDVLSYQWSAGGSVLGATSTVATSLPLGTNRVALTVADPCGASSQADVTIVVRDTTPPTGSCPAALTASAGTNCQALVPNVLAQVVVSDNCTPANELILAQDPPAGTLVGLGSLPLAVTVTDASGNSSTCGVLFTVADTTPPHICSLAASPSVLSPANGRLVPVSLSVVAKDGCDPAPVTKLLSVTCNDQVPAESMQITGRLTALLAASKSPSGGDRVYTLTVQSTDVSGNASTASVTVTVPHDNSGKTGGSPAVKRKH